VQQHATARTWRLSRLEISGGRKADQDRPKGRTIVCGSGFEQNCSDFERAPEHQVKNLSVPVLVVLAPRAMLWGVAAFEAES
jgi:hypothetical protein